MGAIADRYRRMAERKALANALRETYDLAPEDPGFETGAVPGFEAQPEGLTMREGPNVRNALNQLYQGEGTLPAYAFELEQRLGKGRGQEKMPAPAIQYWQKWNEIGQTQGPEAQKVFENLIRNTKQIVDIGGVKHLVDKGIDTTKTPLGTLAGETGAKAQLAAAQRAGAVSGEAGAQAQIDLPKVEDEATNTVGLINQLLKHPGLSTAVGKSRLTMAHKIPGTEAYDFEVLRKQIGGKQFMQAYQTLKGGGQITEIEGQQARDALARMDAAQTEEAFKQGARDFQSIINKGVERARNLAGVNLSPGESKYKIGQITTGPDGRKYVIKSLKPDGTPDDVEPTQ